MPTFTTWSRSHTCSPAEVVFPTSEDEVVALVRRAASEGKRVKVVGGGHSFSPIAMTDGILVSLLRLDRRVAIDHQRGRVTFEAGIRLRALNDALAAEGLALPIVGSVDAQSLAGLAATGTHGSSLRHGNLSSFIVGMRLVTGTGEVLELGQDDPRLPAARVALGALGIVSQITLRVEPAFRVAQAQHPMPFEAAVAAFPQAAAESEYCKLWWIPHTDRAVIFRGDRTQETSTFSERYRAFDERVINGVVFSAALGLGNVFPSLIPAINRLVAAVHFRPDRVVGRSDHVLTLAMPPVHREAEQAIPAESAPEALRRMRRKIEEGGWKVNFIVEARYVKGDDAWMSPAYGRDSVQLGAYIASPHHREAWFDGLAEIAREYGGRPHWGKELRLDPDAVRRLYPRAQAFADLARELDPQGIFRNPFLEEVLGA